MNFRNAASITAGVAVLALVGSFAPSRSSAQNPNVGSAPVTIVNPVPLPVTGTVAISNSPTVSFSNTNVSPLFVRNIDDPARNAYQERQFFFWKGQRVITITFSQVPAGKRLVVTDVSGDLGLTNAAIQRALLQTRSYLYVPDIRINFTTTLEGQYGTTQYRAYHQQVHFYVDAGGSPEVQFETAGLNEFEGYNNVAVAGYYVNLP